MTAISPDCRDGNHRKCDGAAWDEEIDNITGCRCSGCSCRMNESFAESIAQYQRKIDALELEQHILKRRIRISAAIICRPLVPVVERLNLCLTDWRASRLGHLLGIHSPSAHLLAGCWCQR